MSCTDHFLNWGSGNRQPACSLLCAVQHPTYGAGAGTSSCLSGIKSFISWQHPHINIREPKQQRQQQQVADDTNSSASYAVHMSYADRSIQVRRVASSRTVESDASDVSRALMQPLLIAHSKGIANMSCVPAAAAWAFGTPAASSLYTLRRDWHRCKTAAKQQQPGPHHTQQQGIVKLNTKQQHASTVAASHRHSA